uniref:Uncharacterized protein n=1 Tax=Scophthalmus maximus TaxID=52904 RepID=A0A8D3AKT2_SCOMX
MLCCRWDLWENVFPFLHNNHIINGIVKRTSTPREHLTRRHWSGCDWPPPAAKGQEMNYEHRLNHLLPVVRPKQFHLFIDKA